MLSDPLFFFDSYALHRDLHSFPTRRSSDLFQGCRVAKNAAGMPMPKTWIKMPLMNTGHTNAPRGVALDRKSTRLNSSHSSISYAVFRLKKKNREHLIDGYAEHPRQHIAADR